MPKKKKRTVKIPKHAPLPSRLQKLFDGAKSAYSALSHRIAYTAFDLAATLHIPLVDVVKTLLVKTEGGYTLVLLSAAQQLDLKRFMRAAQVKKASISSEKEMVKKFNVHKRPLASFGSLYKLPVYIDRALLKKKKALFSIGSFRQSVLLPIKDYLVIERPAVGSFGVSKKFKKPKKSSSRKKPHARRKG